MLVQADLFLPRLGAELTKPVNVFWRSIAPGLDPSDSLYMVDNTGVINPDGSMTLDKVKYQVYGPDMPVYKFSGEKLAKVRLSRFLNGHRLYLETHMVGEEGLNDTVDMVEE